MRTGIEFGLPPKSINDKESKSLLSGIDFNKSTEQELPLDIENLPKINQIVMLFNELGIIDYLKKEYAEFNKIPQLSALLSLLTSKDSETIKRCLRDINTGQKNDPYKNEDNLREVNSRLMKLGLRNEDSKE